MRLALIALVLSLSLPAYALWGSFGSGAGDLSGGSVPAGGDYLNIPEYNSTIGLFELTSFTAGGVLTNRAYTATDTMTNGASANAITSIAETNGISALGSLDGTSDYANGSRFAGLENAQKATFSIWLKPNSTIVATDNIFNKYLNNDNYLSLQCSSASDFYFIGEGNTPTGYATTTNAGHVHNVWTHHTWVYDGTQADNASRLKYYWNGKEQGLNFTGTIQANLANNGEVLWLGKQRVNAWYYDGDMDGFTIWTNALTSEDATNLFWQTCWNNPTNEYNGVQINPGKGYNKWMYDNRNGLYRDALVLYTWEERLSSGINTVSYDLNGRNIDNSSSMSYVTEVTNLYADGTSGYEQITDISAFTNVVVSATNHTWWIWVNNQSDNNARNTIMQFLPAAGNLSSMWIEVDFTGANNWYSILVSKDSELSPWACYRRTATDTATTGQWDLLTWTGNGVTNLFYINGVLSPLTDISVGNQGASWKTAFGDSVNKPDRFFLTGGSLPNTTTRYDWSGITTTTFTSNQVYELYQYGRTGNDN